MSWHVQGNDPAQVQQVHSLRRRAFGRASAQRQHMAQQLSRQYYPVSLRVTSVDDLPPALREQAKLQLGGAHAALRAEQRKYRNQPHTLEDGTRFDSRLEWRCFEWIKARHMAGEVAWFTRQVPFQLEGGVIYRSDFL